MLLISSYYSYLSVKPEYLLLLIGSTAVNYALGRAIGTTKAPKRYLLSFGILFNLLILGYFKYFNFLGSELNALFRTVSLNFQISPHSLILPIGISFYTFMALGYLLDVYWETVKPQRNYLTFSLYLGFFPYIICGPIGRAGDLFKQLSSHHKFEYEKIANGMRLIVWGLFKKMVIADCIAVYVNAVFGNIPMHSAPTLTYATLLFPIQLYTDFSGYTDIARGVGKLMGFNLMVNFRTPYFNSVSITQYWKKNHISLTSWFREYVFYPFLGTSTSIYKLYAGILIMFVTSGIWHGAGWMFVIWGVVQSAYLVLEDITGYGKKKVKNTFSAISRRVSTFILLAAGLLFFRLPALGDFIQYARAMLSGKLHFYYGSKSIAFSIVAFTGLLIIIELLMNEKQFDEFISTRPVAVRWASYTMLCVLISAFGYIDGSAFLYTQF